MTRPTIEPGLLAELIEAAPARVRRRLEAAPVLADGWEWATTDDGWQVTASGETVRLTGGRLSASGQIACTCLLAPRCLHLLAVLTQLDTAPDEPSAPVEVAAEASLELNAEQLAAVRLLWEAGARLLLSGAQSAGALQRADLLRSAQAAREAALPRAAGAATRVAAGVRDLAADRPSFSLDEFAGDLADLLTTAHRLSRAPRAEDIGFARRAYEPIGAVRLHGLFSEPVVAGSGYAGVVTYLADEGGRLWSVSDVLPGGRDLVTTAYRGATRLGRLSLGHHDLGRAGVFGQGLTASPDGRLGGGERADAARLPGTSWDAPPLSDLWERPLADQIERALTGGARAGADLLFVDAEIVGSASNGLILGLESGAVFTPLPGGSARRLGALAGERIRVIGRPHPVRPRTLLPLAVSSPALRLPDERLGRINLGLDEIPGGAVGGAVPGEPLEPHAHDDPLAALRRTLHRAAVGGRMTLTSSSLHAECARLRRAHLMTAAGLLDRLRLAAAELERTATGESRPAPPGETARAWTAAMTYLQATHRALLHAAWA